MNSRRLHFAHVTTENSPVCVTKVDHVNTLFIKEKKEIEKTEKGYRLHFR